jgi:hypothetical protein
MESMQANVKYVTCCTDRWRLVRDTDGQQFEVILSDRGPELLNSLRDRLNTESDFTVHDAVEIYCQEHKGDNYIYDFLATVTN